jgi:sugar/nucleoside kinase (ribokinase family)
MIALLGNLTRDLMADSAPRVGGGAYHGARALRELEVRGHVYARCAAADRDELLPPLVRLGTPVTYVPGDSTAVFSFAYDGERRRMRIESLGDAWQPDDLPELSGDVGWVHVSPVARSDFPVETLAALARGRRISLDGQGVVRAPVTGDLRLDGDFDPELLRHLWVLKLSDEEASAVGDPAGLGVPEVVVTHGSRGSTVYVDGRAEHIPAHPLEGDPTGAGDAFAVGYLAARSSGSPPAAAARRATSLVASLLMRVR